MPDVPTLLANAFALPAPPNVRELHSGSICAMTGQPIACGYPLDSILSDATAGLADTFPYRSHSVSVPVARAFGGRLIGNLAVIDGAGVRPVVALKSATPERPAWRDLIRQLAPGQQTVVVMSDESQRRLWPRAAGGTVGANWPILLNDSGGCRLLRLDAAALIDCLDQIESIYARGFSKEAMRRGLLASRSLETIRQIGLPETSALERQLVAWRARPEFPVAVFVAQKEET